MHRPAESEKRFLSVLLKHSELSHPWQEDTIGTYQKKQLCGWKQVRPSAAYVIPSTPSMTRRKRVVQGAQACAGQQSQNVSAPSIPLVPPYMSGYLDEDYSYVYRGGLSSEARQDSASYPLYRHFPTQTKSTIELEPVLPYRHADPSTRTDISRIVSMQLKPEILVEHLLIENRLRTMSLGKIPSLEGVGVNGDQKAAQKSDSAPLLRKTTSQAAKKRRQKVQPHLEWCKLNTADSDSLPQIGRLKEQYKERLTQAPTQQNDTFPFRNFSYSQQGRLHDGLQYRHTLNPFQSSKFNSQSSVNNASKQTESAIQQSVPAVEPILERTAPVNGYPGHKHFLETQTQPPNTLTSLLKLWKNTPVRF